jgi:toxin-antitoxin system PIN domain toxin
VIAVDTNILVYAHRADSPFHEAALERIVSLAEGAVLWAIPWPCLHEFLAIVTHPRIYAPPTPLARALDQIDAWADSPIMRLLGETETHWPKLRALLTQTRIGGPQIHDARIAAICQQHGVHELWSADRDFGRFPALRVVNPLIGAGRA